MQLHCCLERDLGCVGDGFYHLLLCGFKLGVLMVPADARIAPLRYLRKVASVSTEETSCVVINKPASVHGFLISRISGFERTESA